MIGTWILLFVGVWTPVGTGRTIHDQSMTIYQKSLKMAYLQRALYQTRGCENPIVKVRCFSYLSETFDTSQFRNLGIIKRCLKSVSAYPKLFQAESVSSQDKRTTNARMLSLSIG